MGLYRRTAIKEGLRVSGEELAAAFDDSCSVQGKTLFFKCINEAKITKVEAELLKKDFNLRSIQENKEEKTLLLTMLLDTDEPSKLRDEPVSMRKETMLHLLNYCNDKPGRLTDRGFTMFGYDQKGSSNGETDECLKGWYYYQFNEYWQVACTAIFNGCLDLLEELKGPGWMSLQELINEAVISNINFLKECTYCDDGKSLLDDTIHRINEDEKEIYINIMKSRVVQRMANGFMLLWKLYEKNKDHFFMLNEYANKHDLGSTYDGLTYLNKLDSYLSSSIEDFIKGFLLRNIIYRHQFVAYRKMGGGSQSTQKFTIEDGLIRQIGNFGPGFTSPRVGNMITYLKDLHLVNAKDEITNKGLQIINNYN